MQLKTLGGRLEGLFYIEEALYESDKHVDDNYYDLVVNLGMAEVKLNNLKDVYVLGHSFGKADFGYFYHLAYAMNGVNEDPFDGITDWCLEFLAECDEMEFLFLNLDYTNHHRERLGEGGCMSEMPGVDTLSERMYGVSEGELPHDQKKILERAAVKARFLIEQGARDAQNQFELLDAIGEYTEDDKKEFEEHLKKVGWSDCQDIIRDVLIERKGTPKQPKNTPKWHISYYSSDDKTRIENVMKRSNYSNYELYPSIDLCIEKYKKV